MSPNTCFCMQADTNARTARHRCLHHGTRTSHHRSATRTSTAAERLPPANRATAPRRCGRSHRPRTASHRQAHRNWRRGDWPRQRSLASASLDNCRPAALARARGKARRSPNSRGVRFSQRLPGSDRGGLQAPRPLHVVRGEEALRSFDAGGIDVLSSDLASFRAAITAENHTLKRALTDPRLLSGIGNAYSDEILHAAQLSPLTLTQKLKPQEWERLFAATRHTLQFWIDRLRAEATAAFPEKVTAFRKGMAVHGRYGEPCPRCGDKVLRIRYADKETNYCARCQTAGKVLADRSLSRLLGSDWPRTLEELEALKHR